MLAVEEAIAEFNCDVINDKFVYVGGLRDRAQDVSSRLTLPDQRTIARQLKDMGYEKQTIGSKHQGPKISVESSNFLLVLFYLRFSLFYYQSCRTLGILL